MPPGNTITDEVERKDKKNIGAEGDAPKKGRKDDGRIWICQRREAQGKKKADEGRICSGLDSVNIDVGGAGGKVYRDDGVTSLS